MREAFLDESGAFKLSTEVLVIGSGFSGAIAAHKLVEAGFNVTMLERGYWQKTIPTQSMGIKDAKSLPVGLKLLTMLRNISHPLLPKNGLTMCSSGLLEFASYSGANLMCASAVGGGSLVYGGLLERSPNPEYWNQVHPELSEANMQPHEAYVRTLLKPSQPRSTYNIPNFPPLTLCEDTVFDACESDQPDMGILFPEEYQCSHASGVKRLPTDYRGDSVFGSYKGSKVSVDFAVLKAALDNGLKLLSGCEVSAIRFIDHCYRVTYTQVRTGKKYDMYADKIVLAAGALNSVKLLFKNQRNLKPMPGLGKGFGTNGDYAAYWRCQNQNKDYSVGTPCHGRVKIKGLENAPDMVLANIGLPVPKSPLIPNLLTSPFRSTKKDLMIIGMGADSGDGEYSYHNNRLDIAYSTENSPIFENIRTAFSMIEEKTGKPLYYAQKATTVHQYGGARLAENKFDGVVDANGEVFNNAGIYIVDASALAQAAGGPPSMTVCTWAAHVAECIVQSNKPRKREPVSVPTASVKGSSFSQLDVLFAGLPVVESSDFKGAFKGSLVMMMGLSWLPTFIRKSFISGLEAFLFRGWYGKSFSDGGGVNLFKRQQVTKKVMPFRVAVQLSRDGAGNVLHLNYDLESNSERLKLVSGEAKRLNANTLLARMYFKRRKIVYYTLTAD